MTEKATPGPEWGYEPVAGCIVCDTGCPVCDKQARLEESHGALLEALEGQAYHNGHFGDACGNDATAGCPESCRKARAALDAAREK